MTEDIIMKNRLLKKAHIVRCFSCACFAGLKARTTKAMQKLDCHSARGALRNDSGGIDCHDAREASPMSTVIKDRTTKASLKAEPTKASLTARTTKAFLKARSMKDYLKAKLRKLKVNYSCIFSMLILFDFHWLTL